jgi:hypothetical protein
VVSHVGAALLRMLADRAGLTTALSAGLARRGRWPVHDRGIRLRPGNAGANIAADHLDILAEAIERGYVEVPRFNDETYAHHWFEKRLTT